MTDVAVYFVLGWAIGVLIGYVVWAPGTPFKRAFVRGLSFKFIWGRWVK